MSKSRGNGLSPHRPPPGVRPAAPAQNPRPPRLAKILATAPVSRFPHRSVATRTYRGVGGARSRATVRERALELLGSSEILAFVPVSNHTAWRKSLACLAPNADCGRDVARRRGAERCHRRPWPQKKAKRRLAVSQEPLGSRIWLPSEQRQ